MKDLAVNGMNAISAVADILILLGLFCGAIYLVIDTYIIMDKTVAELFTGVSGLRCGLNNIKKTEDTENFEKIAERQEA